MTVEECYQLLHGSYGDAKSRLMNDRLVEKFMLKFPGDDSMARIRDAVKAGDIEGAFMGAHTLKGVAANLGFSELQAAASDLTEQLRSRTQAPDAGLVQKVEDCYRLVIDTLKAYESQKQ